MYTYYKISRRPLALIRSILTVVNGNVIAQIVALAALPVISKIFSDEDFGRFQLFFSLVIITLPFASLRLEYPLMKLIGSPREVSLALTLCLGINVIGALVLLFFIFLGGIEALWPATTELLFPTWLLPFSFIAFGALQTFNTLAVRNNAYQLISRARIIQSISFNSLAICAGMILASAPILLIMDIISRIGSTFSLFRASIIAPLGRLDKTDLYWMRDFFVENRRYPLFSVPSGVLSGLSMGLPVIALASIFTIAEVGQFSMAWRVTLLPIGVLAFSVSQVVNGRIATIIREEDGSLRPHILRIAAFLFALGFIAGLIVIAFGAFAVELILGDEWQLTGILLTQLVPVVISTVAVGPLNTMLTLIGYQRAQIIWDITRIAGFIVVFTSCSRIDADIATTVLYFSWTAAFFSFTYLVILIWLSNRST